MTFPRKATNADLLATTASHVLAIETVGGKTRGPRRQAIASLSAQLAASGPLADRVNAAATGIVVNGLNKLNAIIDPPLNAKAEIRGSGNPAVDGVYGKSAPAGQAGWTRLADLDSASSAAIAALQDVFAAIDDSRFANLSPGPDHGTVDEVQTTVGEVTTTTRYLRLVFVGGHGGQVLDDYQRVYELPTLNVTNDTEFITMKVVDEEGGGEELPIVPIDDNTKWALGSLPTDGKMFAVREDDRYRVFSPYGIQLSKAVWDDFRKRVPIPLGLLEVDQNNSGVTIYTALSDSVPTNVLVDGYSFYARFPATNLNERAKLRIIKTNRGSEVCPPTEIVNPDGSPIRANGIPAATVLLKASEDPDCFEMLTGDMIRGGGVDLSPEFLEKLIIAASSSENGPNALVMSRRMTEFETAAAEKFKNVEEWTGRAEAATRAALAASAPGLLGYAESYATTLRTGDVVAANGALTPVGWKGNTQALGPFIRVDSAQFSDDEQVVGNPNLIHFQHGVRYTVTFVLTALDEGTSGGDLVRLALQLMKSDYTALDDDDLMEIWSGRPKIADNPIEHSATLSYDGDGVDFQIPAEAMFSRAIGLFSRGTSVNAFRFANIREKSDGDDASDVAELSARVEQTEASLETTAREVDSLDPEDVMLFLDGAGRRLGGVRDTADGAVWDIGWLKELNLAGGASLGLVDSLDPPDPIVFLDAEGRPMSTADPVLVSRVTSAEARVTAAEARATAAEARLEQLEHGVLFRRHLARINMKRAMLLGGDVTFETLRGVFLADSKRERSGCTRIVTKVGRREFGNAGMGALRLFNGTGFATAECGQLFENRNNPTQASNATGQMFDKKYPVSSTGTWTIKGPKDNDAGTTPAASVFLSSGTATAAASVTVTAAAGLTTQTDMDLYYDPHPGAACRYRIGTGAWASLDLSSGFVQPLIASLAASTALTIEWVTGEVELNGLDGLNGQPGLVIDKIAMSGSRLVEHWSVYAQTEGFAAQLAAMKPDFVVIDLGTNDSTSPEAFVAAMASLVARLRTIMSWSGQLGLDIIICAPVVYMGANGQGMAALQPKLKEFAAANRCAFLNNQDGFPLGPNGETTAYQNPAFWDDGKHEQNPYGMSAAAGSYLSILGL